MKLLLLSFLPLLPLLPLVSGVQFPFSFPSFPFPNPALPPSHPSTSHPPHAPSHDGGHSPSNSRSFSLRQAVHLSTTNRHFPVFHRQYSDADRQFSISSLPSSPDSSSTALSIKTTKARAYIPSSQKAFQAARRADFFTQRAILAGRALSRTELEDQLWAATLEWQEKEIEVPDVTDWKTLNTLGKMTANAYILPDETGWYDLDGKWNVSDSFGWVEDGVRGHIFADETNSTIIVSIKGTSGAVTGAPTGKNDKTSDNLLFSCCCARVDWSWRTVCDCYSGSYTCQQNCLEEAVMTKSAYYPVVTDLFNNITALYPHSQIWLTGHSLGGALASLLSLTYGVPSTSFEAPADHLAASRLHLPSPPGLSHFDSQITVQVRHTADPIAMGTCTGVTSSCAIAGFAMESKCHSGRNIVYDTVGVLGWSVDIRTHGIIAVVENVLIEEWGVPKKDRQKTVGTLDDGKKEKVEKRGWGWWPGGGGTKPPPLPIPDQPEDEEPTPAPPTSTSPPTTTTSSKPTSTSTSTPIPKDPTPPEEDVPLPPPVPHDPQHGGRGVPDWQTEEECMDCFKWEYIE